jgi:hypothetical protein
MPTIVLGRQPRRIRLPGILRFLVQGDEPPDNGHGFFVLVICGYKRLCGKDLRLYCEGRDNRLPQLLNCLAFWPAR